MKKVSSLILVLVCIATLILIFNKTNKQDTSLNFSFDRNGKYAGFSGLPLKYTAQDAKDDRCFVIQNLEVFANKNVWDNFIETSLHRENTGIRIVNFYTENIDSPYFLDLFYEDGHYYLFDSSAKDQEKKPYLYLLTLEGKFGNPSRDSGTIILTNDKTLDFNTVMKVNISSNMDYIKSISPFKMVMYK